MAGEKIIVGLGEALFDLFPDGAKLGGAPLNVAVHAQQLGNRGVVVSRIGDDPLGRQVLDELRGRGMSTEYVQVDSQRPTGTVKVELDGRGEPTFTITADVAWDVIAFDEPAARLAGECHAVCFGTLAQREAASRASIQRFLEATEQAVILFDVNLRQHYFSRQVIEASCERASAVKLNSAELKTLGRMFALGEEIEAAAQRLRKAFNLVWVAVTRGAEGTHVFDSAGPHKAPAVRASAGGDAVGAGDSTVAALLHGAVRGWPWEKTLRLANTLGAHVASQSGACPPHTPAIAALAE